MGEAQEPFEWELQLDSEANTFCCGSETDCGGTAGALGEVEGVAQEAGGIKAQESPLDSHIALRK